MLSMAPRIAQIEYRGDGSDMDQMQVWLIAEEKKLHRNYSEVYNVETKMLFEVKNPDDVQKLSGQDLIQHRVENVLLSLVKFLPYMTDQKIHDLESKVKVDRY